MTALEKRDEAGVKYRTIVADQPWPIRWSGGGAWRRNGRGELHYNKRFKSMLDYPTMPVADILALPVESIAEDDAHLYLWTTDRYALNGTAAQVCQAWGFKPLRFLVWRKTGFGLGQFPRPQHELVVIAKRGKLPHRVRNVGSVQTWKLVYDRGRRVHSAKPDGFLDLVELASPGPYVELFARRHRFGWDVWGNESANTAVLIPSKETA